MENWKKAFPTTQMGLDLSRSFCEGLVESVVERTLRWKTSCVDAGLDLHAARRINGEAVRAHQRLIGTVILEPYLYRNERYSGMLAYGCRIQRTEHFKTVEVAFLRTQRGRRRELRSIDAGVLTCPACHGIRNT